MTKTSKNRSRTQLLLIALVFFGPLMIATAMYFSGSLQPDGRTNHGTLLEPIVSVVEALPESPLHEKAAGRWALIYVNDGECTDACMNALYTIRQSRRMLGQEMERLLRVFLHGESSPDTVFLADEHAGLVALQDSALSTLLYHKKPATQSAGGYFLMDPLGNLVLYFQPTIDPSDMVEDIHRLLKLSRIG